MLGHHLVIEMVKLISSDVCRKYKKNISQYSFEMFARDTDMVVMGRGAYDTTGVPKPPPRPCPK